MNRFDVAFRLSASSCLLAAVLIVVGWQGISHLHQLDNRMQSIGGDEWKEVQLSHEAGMDDYMTKPARIEKLREILERWLPK